jgi:hypothetical protein
MFLYMFVCFFFLGNKNFHSRAQHTTNTLTRRGEERVTRLNEQGGHPNNKTQKVDAVK